MSGLRCEGLTKSFGGVRALAGVDLELSGAGIDAIIGPNGAGKSTLLGALTGFLELDAGRVSVDGRDVTGWPAYRIARLGLTRSFQDLRLVRDLSVLDNVLIGCRQQVGERLLPALFGVRATTRRETENRRLARELLALVGLAEMTEEVAGSLSYGQQKLLNLACCLATEPRFLLLDEPVAGVHPKLVTEILDLLVEIRDQGRSVLFIEHDIAAVRRVADRVVVMDRGEIIVEGAPGDVLDRPEILEAYLE